MNDIYWSKVEASNEVHWLQNVDVTSLRAVGIYFWSLKIFRSGILQLVQSSNLECNFSYSRSTASYAYAHSLIKGVKSEFIHAHESYYLVLLRLYDKGASDETRLEMHGGTYIIAASQNPGNWCDSSMEFWVRGWPCLSGIIGRMTPLIWAGNCGIGWIDWSAMNTTL